MSKDFKRIYELEDRIFNGNVCIYTYDSVAPETFAADITGLFNADVEKDVLRNVLVGDEEGMANCTFVVLPEPIDNKDLFIKLADYVNGIQMEYALCCCKDKDGTYKIYEIDSSDEYVEGGYEPFITNEESDGVVVGEENILLLDDRIELGADKNVLPSPTVMFIDQGEHYIEHLIGPNDEKLM